MKCILCSCITCLQSCSPTSCSARYTLCSISIISLQTCAPLAGLRVYTHYVRPQEVHHVMSSFASAKCGPSSHSANILYMHYEAHPLYFCKAGACQLVQQHTHTMQDVIKCILYWSIVSLQSCSPSGCSASIHTLCSNSIISLQSCGPLAGPTAYIHYVRTQEVHHILICCIPATCGPSSHSLSMHTPWSIFIISLQSCGPPAGPTAYTQYVGCHKVNPTLIQCISASCNP